MISMERELKSLKKNDLPSVCVGGRVDFKNALIRSGRIVMGIIRNLLKNVKFFVIK